MPRTTVPGGYTRAQLITALLANAYLIAMPGLFFTGVLGNPGFAAGYGLVVTWVVAFTVSFTAGTPSQPTLLSGPPTP